MRKICLLLSVLISTIACAELDEGVIVLTDDNFDEEIAKHPFLLVEFYAPWCGHCKKLAPEYSAAAKILAENDPAYPLGKVDATEQKKIAEKFGVQGFPTLFFFKNGEKMEYTGGRTTDAIVQWIIKKSGPPSTSADCETIKKKVAESKFVMAYFGAESDALFKEGFEPVADAEEKIGFFHTSDAACAEHYKASAPGVVFFRKFETEVNVYTGTADKDALKSFFKPLMVPTLFKFTEEEIEAVFGQQQNCMILFRKESQADDEFVKNFAQASEDHKGKMLFAFSDGTVDIQEKLADFMGVTDADLPTLRAITPEKMQKFKFEDTVGLTADSVGKWVDGIIDGSLKPHLKSDPVPESNDEPVKIVVGTQFEEIVLNKDKDVFVKFYAPWCGHCKKLVPIWEELAEHYKDKTDLVIAKFDSTTNEAEGVDVRGYPTLIFYPKGSTEGITYEGDRDLEGFQKYLSETAASVKGEPAAEAVKEDL